MGIIITPKDILEKKQTEEQQELEERCDHLVSNLIGKINTALLKVFDIKSLEKYSKKLVSVKEKSLLEEKEVYLLKECVITNLKTTCTTNGNWLISDANLSIEAAILPKHSTVTYTADFMPQEDAFK